jgi:HlyD family secretion protein
MKVNSHLKWLAIPGVVLIAVLAVVFLALPREKTPVQAQANPVTYQTVQLQKGDLTAYVSSTGAVRSKQTTILAWQTSGTVSKVNASEGQTVPQGSVLAELEQTSLPQTVILAQTSLVAAQKNLDNLLKTNQARANAALALANAQKALDDAQDARRNKQYQRASQEMIDLARANLILAKNALDDAETIYNRNKNRSEDDVIYAAALSQLANAQMKYDKAQNNYWYVTGLPDPIDIQIADASVEVAQANLLAAKVEWDRVKDGPNDQDVAAAQAQVAAAQATLNMARISAPFNGTVTMVNNDAGDQVAPGTVAFQIDDLSHLYVDMEISQVDINKVRIGQPVTLTFDAIPDKDYPGTVTDISEVGASIAGVVNFKVTVEVSQKAPEIKPGMTVSADIAVSQVSGALLVPDRAVLTRDGKSTVYVLKNGAPMAVEIELGAASGGYSAVTSGNVRAGDLIVLNPGSLTQ